MDKSRIPHVLRNLRIPVIASPLFIVSGPDLVIEQCKSGIVGSFPALNARPASLLETWLQRIQIELKDYQSKHPEKKVAPFAVNQIVHHSNARLEEDMALCVKYKVPIIITSLNSPKNVVKAAHSYGGVVFHDITNVKHAKKALEAGVDGLIAVCAGAGGHAGTLSPFALVPEIRKFYNGPLILAGSITDGRGVNASLALGADFAYMGTRFIASKEAMASDEYKKMIVDSSAEDILYTPYFSGVPGNYLIPSITRSGLDPHKLPTVDKSKMDFSQDPDANKSEKSTSSAKAWKDIWGAGQGVGNIDQVLTTSQIVDKLESEFLEARKIHSNL